MALTCPNPTCARAFDPVTRPGAKGVTCPFCGGPVPSPRKPSLRELCEGGPLAPPKASGRLIAFTCTHPACGATVRARADRVGSRAVCPKCGQGIVIGGGPTPPAPPAHAGAAKPLVFHCPGCHKRLRAYPGKLGRTLTCPSCQERVTVDEALLEGKTPLTTRERTAGTKPTPPKPVVPPSSPEPAEVEPLSPFEQDWLHELTVVRPDKPGVVKTADDVKSNSGPERLAFLEHLWEEPVAERSLGLEEVEPTQAPPAEKTAAEELFLREAAARADAEYQAAEQAARRKAEEQKVAGRKAAE